MDEVILLNNRFQGEGIGLSVFSPHFNYGQGFFETLLYENDRIYFLQEHLNRIEKTCRFWGILLDMSWLTEARLLELIKKNNLGTKPARLKILYAPMGQRPEKWDLCVYVKEYVRDNSSRRVCVHSEIRDSVLFAYKSLNYQANLYWKSYYQNDADEVLFVNTKGNVLEASISNVLYIKKNQLYFSGDHHSYLKGIMQAKILELARQLDLPPLACNNGLKIGEMITADEVILTNSLMIAQPCSLLIDKAGYKHNLKAAGWAKKFRKLILN